MSWPIEQLYLERMNQLTMVERVARSAAMFQWTRDLLARQVVQEMGPMSPEQLKWEVAKRVYANEPLILSFISRKMSDVSS